MLKTMQLKGRREAPFFFGGVVGWVEHSMEPGTMFKLEVHKELIKNVPPDEGGIWVDKKSLVRDDGVRLDLLGTGREFENYFRYTDRDLSVEFTAKRYDDNREPTDTWEVELGPALEKYSRSSSSAITPEKARVIAGIIHEALMAWPRYPSQPVIRQVKFLMKFWSTWNPAWGDWL